MAFITLDNISKNYSERNIETRVFTGLSLTIEEGKFYAITGRSGSGKTTLLNIIGLLDFSFTGSMIFNGHDVRKLTEKQYSKIRNEDVGFVFQDYKLIPDLNVYDNIEVPLAFSKKFSRSQRREKILSLLDELGLQGKESHYPNELSGGQKQRVSIARAIINQPKLIIADEPTGNLDIESAHRIMNILKKLNQDRGLTIVLVTHDDMIRNYANIHFSLEELSRHL